MPPRRPRQRSPVRSVYPGDGDQGEESDLSGYRVVRHNTAYMHDPSSSGYRGARLSYGDQGGNLDINGVMRHNTSYMRDPTPRMSGKGGTVRGSRQDIDRRRRELNEDIRELEMRIAYDYDEYLDATRQQRAVYAFYQASQKDAKWKALADELSGLVNALSEKKTHE